MGSEPGPFLIDHYNRRLSYLRISITDRCNLRCLYCIPRKGVPKLRHEDILTYEEILRIARIAVGLGVEKIRLTGGEPLLRKGIYSFLPQLASLPGLKDVSLTTNGVYLKGNLKNIKSSGIRRINVSLDTLHREKYERITGQDRFEAVWEGIETARAMGFHPIKINVVTVKGLNDDEILDFARLSLDHPYYIRFIEYMPLGMGNPVIPLTHVSTDHIKEQLKEIGSLTPVTSGRFDGPAERFRFKGAAGEIGFISPLSHHFCATCNRLRLTASGSLRPCLLSDIEEDLKGPLRDGASDMELADIFKKAADMKPPSHYLASTGSIPPSGHMSAIGG